MSPAILEASRIRHSYEALRLDVDHVSVDRGAVLCILGPSGAGKSTLLRILGLLERPQSGEVRVAGQPAGPASLQARRKIAAALQASALWRGTVLHNVEFGLRVRGVGRRERRARAEAALATVGLEGLADRSGSELSGGQAQRVALARALAVEPEIVLLDEPLAHIDEPLRESLAIELQRFALRTGCATVWVTHDRAEALAVSDRVAVMHDGRVLQTGDAMEVFARPADERVAAVVGADNLIPGRVARSDRGLARIEASGMEIEATSDLPPGCDVLVLVRPEDLSVWTQAPAGSSPRNRLAGSLREAVTLGPVTKLYVDAGVPLVALVTRPTYEELGLGPGSRVWVGFKATSAHVIRRP